ncbi:MAG: lytic transglycosylase domain-containing protein [Acidobacteriota bacterium]|nr:lytic transglycosylase domain-containing protein [Acidobacteriota bacterium]
MFLLYISSTFAVAGMRASSNPSVSDEVLLRAIAQVETGNRPGKIGRYGERTRVQIMPATWRRFSRVPQSASDPAETNRVARAYLAYIRRRLRERDLPENAFYLAACWNAGACWHRLRRSTVNYAERVENLVREYERAAIATPAEARAATTVVNAPPPAAIPVIDLGAAPSPRTGLQPLDPAG